MDESGSEAPETVSFSKGKEQELKALSIATAQAKRNKKNVKELRTKRQQLYRSQKIVREKKKESQRFPQAELKSLVKLEKQSSKEEEISESVVSLKKQRKRKRRKVYQFAPDDRERSIKGVKVVVLPEEQVGSVPVTVARDRAADFLHRQLYQSTRYQRIPAATSHCLKYYNKPADVFI